jgi:antitoxin component YwqK of YwqJK toxin-antitoxin module
VIYLYNKLNILKKYNSLNEEINRMKSLFGNDRLYGNLITEQVKELPEIENKKTVNLGSIISGKEDEDVIVFFYPEDGLAEKNDEKVKEIYNSIDKTKTNKKYSFFIGKFEDFTNPKQAAILGNTKLIETFCMIYTKDEKRLDRTLGLMQYSNYIKEGIGVEHFYKIKLPAEICMKRDYITPYTFFIEEFLMSENSEEEKEQPQEKQTTTTELSTKQPKCEDIDGLKVDEIDYVPDDYTGVAFICYDNGKVKKLYNYKDGKEDGVQRGWYENGQLAYERNYKDGETVGVFRWWHKNGQLEFEWTYKDGKEDGVQRRWYENGQLAYEWNKKDGKDDGVFRNWYENGQLDYEEYYINGKEVSKEEYENINSDVNLPKKEPKLPELEKPKGVEKSSFEFNLSEKQCVDFVKDSYDAINDNIGDWKRDNRDGKNKLWWCYNEYPKKFIVNNPISNLDDKVKKINSMLGINVSNIEISDEKGKEGKKDKGWINIMGNYDNIIAKIKKISGNEYEGNYKFKSAANVSTRGINIGNDLIMKSVGGGLKKFKPHILTNIKKALAEEGLQDDNTHRIVITITKSTNLKGFDFGEFKVTKVEREKIKK